jgi:hypothetical protein
MSDVVAVTISEEAVSQSATAVAAASRLVMRQQAQYWMD